MGRLIIFGIIGAILGLMVFNVARAYVGEGPVLLVSIVLLVVVFAVLLRNLSGNRKVADASSDARARALTFAPDPHKAALYVLRTQFVGMAVGLNIAVDGREIAQLKSPRFTRVALAPGAHRITGYYGAAASRKGEGAVEISAGAGEVIVLRIALEPQMVGSLVKFTQVPIDSARPDLQKTRMIAADVAEV